MMALLACLQLAAQRTTITFKEDKSDFANPERGFYIPSGTKAGSFQLLDASVLGRYRNAHAVDGMAAPFYITLLYRGYELDIFKNKPLSEDFLDNLQKDFNAVRSAGLKLILRFAYTNESHAGDCKDEYKICPPYGDAPVAVVMQHVQQLKPLLQKNADVIAVLQEGFIGIWGENYFTDYFGYAGDDGEGRITDSSWQLRNELLASLLDAMPKTRMVQVRTPQIKQRYVYGPRAATNAAPLQQTEAFKRTDKARIGLHNDCFLASVDDYGTFYDYGNSVSGRDTANAVLRRYFEADSRYVAVGGETCDDAFSPQNDCAPAGYAETEMKNMHYSYLNSGYNKDVARDWDSGGCMHSIKTKLGYRILLKKAVLPLKVRNRGKITVQLDIKNLGYASPFNPRPLQLLLRNTVTGTVTIVPMSSNVQQWFPGDITVKEILKLPALKKGRYQLLLNMPDGYTSLSENPAYSIRLANEDTWEAATGYNSLKHEIIIE